jgi:hypothetical protein
VKRAENMRVVNALGRARVDDNFAAKALAKALDRKVRTEVNLIQLGLDPLVRLRELHRRADDLLAKVDALDAPARRKAG